MVKFENFLLTFCVPLTLPVRLSSRRSPLPLGERVGVRGNFKYLWLDYGFFFPTTSSGWQILPFTELAAATAGPQR